MTPHVWGRWLLVWLFSLPSDTWFTDSPRGGLAAIRVTQEVLLCPPVAAPDPDDRRARRLGLCRPPPGRPPGLLVKTNSQGWLVLAIMALICRTRRWPMLFGSNCPLPMGSCPHSVGLMTITDSKLP
jgi:hypothetical protein